MAFNLGDIFVTFKAKTDDLQAGAAKVKTMTQNVEKTVNGTSFKAFSEKASNSFNNVANSMQGVITKAAIIATTSSLGIGTFIKSAADLQQTSKSFEVLTGNVDTANKLFAQLARYANNTPFEFPQIAKGGQILLGFGVQADDVYKRITMLGDIAAATGADFESLALVFGQVTATGKLMGQDSLQLINNKIPITSVLAKKLGVNVQEVKRRMEEGSISAEIFTQALEDVTKEGGFAFHGTDILAQTLNGRLSTLKDTVLEFGRNLIGVKVDPQLGLVVKPGGIFDRISNMVPKITESLAELSPKVEGAFNWIMDHGEEVKNIVIAIGVAFVAAKLAAIGFSIAATANPIGLIVAGIVVLIGALVYLQERFDWIGKTLSFLKPYWDQLVEIFNVFIRPAMDELGKTIMNTLWPALQRLWEALVRLWNAMQPELMDTLKKLGELFGIILIAQIIVFIAVLDSVVKVVSFIIDMFSWLINKLAEFTRFQLDLYKKLGDTVNGIMDWFRKLPVEVGKQIDLLVQGFKDLPKRISDAMSTIGSIMLAPFKEAFNGIAKLWNKSVGALDFKTPDWVPGIGGKGFSMPKIPTFAKGVENFGGGWAVVGERGPELTYLPKGSNVYTNEKSQGMAGRNVAFYGDVNIGSKSDADYFIQRLDRNTQLENMGLSPA